jgi:hypothetical protein
MLWKQLDPRYRRLLSSGQQGEAVVVDAKEDRAKGGGGGMGERASLASAVGLLLASSAGA